jgi:ABC-type Mn2+/Zn2+ transport system permease subunit
VIASTGIAVFAAFSDIVISYYFSTATGGTIVLVSLATFVTFAAVGAARGGGKAHPPSGRPA